MNEKFNKELVEQYELIRQSGITNMFDQVAVYWYARQLGYNELAALSAAEYFELLDDYSTLIDEYGIDVG